MLIRVLVVDDHELVRSGITRMLADNPDIDVLGQVSSGEDAVEFVRGQRPDIVLMDIRMPGIGGLEATRRILRYDDSIRVIAVTACADDPYPARVMQSGAQGYITKGAGIEEMVRAIRKAHSGQRYISPEIAQKMALKQIAGDPDDEGELSLFERLSEREMQIALMVVNCQKVQDISDKLCLSPKTVNTYRYRIFEKLEISSDVELALMAVRLGLVDGDKV
ncbi:LuxR family two component transcriptional regulator [Marinobacter persicus]|jgi:DNA-binding NarL/FixJ family response regulator|uniref:LuxR family two component transcriptional regulator n=1 Tax=Marinobacter persicus TaxID=930118 RepID=A0A2S6G513_9GAMM|nr:MAG: two component LuxR family transcriptional regulator [Marinobacter sp. T13-3]PPK50757.1 LuxR family two component transcriptional regulator [Marinobacter persicus]PPK54209.1 LuxR family two component transcriptional regulator [Marinobacter persicus]PPK57345.1 LuxR family two component transcriptional regulator [Marinobacter persicus]